MKRWISAILAACSAGILGILMGGCECDRVDMYRSAYDLPQVFCGEDYCGNEGDNWYYPPYRYKVCHRPYTTYRTYRTYTTYPACTRRTNVKVHRHTADCCCTSK
jgi:hypothetical protein